MAQTALAPQQGQARQTHQENSHNGILKSKPPARSGHIHALHHTPIIQRTTACPCGGGCPDCVAVEARHAAPLQAKLRIGASNDKYEQEADRIADQVVRMPAGNIQRTCSTCEEKEELIQTKPLFSSITPLVQREATPEEEKEEELIQTKPTDASRSSSVGPDLAGGISSIRGGGRSMSQSERSFFEPRFGADFSSVRIHEGVRANEAAQSVNARAFTLGSDIVFAAGEYSSGSHEGRKLMAHELVHVGQQGGGQFLIQRTPPKYTKRTKPVDSEEVRLIILTIYAEATHGGSNQHKAIWGSMINRYKKMYSKRDPKLWITSVRMTKLLKKYHAFSKRRSYFIYADLHLQGKNMKTRANQNRFSQPIIDQIADMVLADVTQKGTKWYMPTTVPKDAIWFYFHWAPKTAKAWPSKTMDKCWDRDKGQMPKTISPRQLEKRCALEHLKGLGWNADTSKMKIIRGKAPSLTQKPYRTLYGFPKK